mmetsp:Transcript_52408/g.139528  ORF Transcript_52408/g.139528 Transcript_52408/m.139528 type:complete len:227 (+) Transcript_52408:2667-3347(+)
MLAMFWGDSSLRLLIATATACLKRGTCCKLVVAKAHTVLESSCGLNVQSMLSLMAVSASTLKSCTSTQLTLAQAHNVLAISWLLTVAAFRTISSAMLENSGASLCFSVANDQAIIDRHCMLNSASCLRMRRSETALKRAVVPRDSFAYAQSMFDNSKGLKSANCGKTMSAIVRMSWKSRSRRVAHDQHTMLIHCTSKTGSLTISSRLVDALVLLLLLLVLPAPPLR